MKANQLFFSMGITLIFLILFNIFFTATLPALGIANFKIPLNILIVLFLCFKLRITVLSIMILIIQYTNSFFTTEHWTIGTIAGILTVWVLNYLSDIIDLSSAVITILVTLAFSLFWFGCTSVLVYIQLDDIQFLLPRFNKFFPEALFISLMAPFVFSFLDKVWKTGHLRSIEEN
jgi:hypothetical protein